MIWIDKDTGEWGSTDKLVIIENPTQSFVEELEESSPNLAIDLGEEYGTPFDELVE